MGGIRIPPGGRCKVYEYNSTIAGKMFLNKDEIRVAKVIDNLGVKWIRNLKGFEYIDKNKKNRKYYPDFYIYDYDIFIEYKGFIYPEHFHKMKDAAKRNSIKLVVVFSDRTNKQSKKFNPSLSQIEKNPQKLFTPNIQLLD
jgi:D-lyxose ketol-isomerase